MTIEPSSSAPATGQQATFSKRRRFLPPMGSPRLPCPAVVRRHSDSRSSGGNLRRVHEFLDRLLRRRPGARRHPRQRRDTAIRAGRQTRGQLHADHGRLRCRHVRHVRAGSGDGLAGLAPTARVAAHPLLSVHRHVRRRRRHALYPDPGGPPAADLSLRPGGRQHLARADRPAVAQPFDRPPGRQRRNGLRPCPGLGQNPGPRRRGLLRFHLRRRPHCRGAHCHPGAGRRPHRAVADPSPGQPRLALCQ